MGEVKQIKSEKCGKYITLGAEKMGYVDIDGKIGYNFKRFSEFCNYLRGGIT